MTIGTSPAQDADLEPESAARYLYAVVLAGTRAAISTLRPDEASTGIDVVTVDDLAAFVGPVPSSTVAVGTAIGAEAAHPERTLAILEKAVRDHERVVEQVLANAASVVPFRFGTILASTDAVRKLLHQSAEELGASLAALRGRREWGLVVEWRADAAADAARLLADVPPPSATETDGPGHRFFAAKRTERAMADAFRSACAALARELEEALRPLAELRVRHSADRDWARVCLLVASALVAADDDERFATALESVLQRHRGLSATMSGPWPPYSFVGRLPLEVP